jgi:AraC-like DNA-binding protein/mannose-6-phosphate isomerase-like protein (cupin superfamily)
MSMIKKNATTLRSADGSMICAQEILIDNVLPKNRQVHIYEKKHFVLQPYNYHYHTTNQLLYVIDGEGQLYLKNKTLEIKKHDLIIISKNVRHQLSYKAKCQPTVSVINFSDDIFGCFIFGKSLLGFLRRFDDDKTVVSTNDYRLKDVPLLLKEMLFEIKSEFKEYQQLIILKLMEIFLLLKRYHSEGSAQHVEHHASATENKVLDTIRYIEINYYKKLALGEMARMAFISKRQYIRIFKKISGKTFVEFLNGIRVNHAKQILQQGDSKIASVCFETGFEDVSYFYKIFKEFTGTTPKSFKDKLS